MISPRHRAVKRFLRRAKVVHIATLSPAGNADLVPLWFVFFRGCVYMGTRAESAVVRDLIQNPEVALLFHDESGGAGRVLRVRGRASFRRDGRFRFAVYPLAVFRYFLAPGGMRNALANRRKLALRGLYYRERGGESGFIEVVPDTAEFVKLPS